MVGIEVHGVIRSEDWSWAPLFGRGMVNKRPVLTDSGPGDALRCTNDEEVAEEGRRSREMTGLGGPKSALPRLSS